MLNYPPDTIINSIEHNFLNQKEEKWLTSLKRGRESAKHYWTSKGFYNKKNGELFCGCCHRTSTIDKGITLDRFNDFRCPKCYQTLIVKTNKCKNSHFKFNTYFVRKVKNYIIVRHFHVYHNYNFKEINVDYNEFARTIINLNDCIHYNYEYLDFITENNLHVKKWRKGKYHSFYMFGNWYEEGTIYTGNFKSLDCNLKYLKDFFQYIEFYYFDSIIKQVLFSSIFERLYKAGFKKLACETFSKNNTKKVLKELDKVSVKKFVGLKTKKYFDLASKKDVTKCELTELKLDESIDLLNFSFKDSELLKSLNHPFAFIETCKNTGVSVHKTLKYLENQKTDDDNNIQNVVRIYEDYLRFSTENGFDITSHRINQPFDLYDSHDNMVAMTKYRKNKELIDKYQKVCKSITNLNTTINDLQFVVPTDEQGFIKQGRLLNQCVGRGSYFKSMAEGNSFIFFVNKGNSPYLTLELYPNGMLGQCLGLNNKVTPTAQEKDLITNEFVKKHFLKNSFVKSCSH